jgi:hypothetical protein
MNIPNVILYITRYRLKNVMSRVVDYIRFEFIGLVGTCKIMIGLKLYSTCVFEKTLEDKKDV